MVELIKHGVYLIDGAEIRTDYYLRHSAFSRRGWQQG